MMFGKNKLENKPSLQSQLEALNSQEPWNWPMPFKTVVFTIVALFVMFMGWFLFIRDLELELEVLVEQENVHKTEFSRKLQKANNLESLTRQKEQVEIFVNQLEKQLPSKSEMDALLSDINQAGLGRGLSFELFRPGQVVLKEYYAELPIAVRVTGKYHDLAHFSSDVAGLSRIVTLNNMMIVPSTSTAKDKEGKLVLETTAKTFRYLDDDEVKLQQKNKEEAKRLGQAQ